MFTDKLLLFDADASVALDSSSTVYCESVIDLDVIGQVNADGGASGSPIRDIGAGKQVYCWVRVDSQTTMTAAHVSGFTVSLTADALATCTAGSQVLCSKTIYPHLDGTSTSNKPGLHFFEITGQPAATKRYLGCKLVNADTNASGVNVGVGLCMDKPKYKPYNKQAGAKIIGG